MLHNAERATHSDLKGTFDGRPGTLFGYEAIRILSAPLNNVLMIFIRLQIYKKQLHVSPSPIGIPPFAFPFASQANS